jgi:hypothetical protein
MSLNDTYNFTAAKALQTPSQRPPEAVFEEKYLKGWKKKIKANHRKP